MKTNYRLKLFVYIIILVVILGVIFDFSPDNLINNWVVPLGISFIFSGIIGEMIEKNGGAFLKKVFIQIPIRKFNFSVSVFAVSVIIIKYWLFN